ncbi:uncharacterized protein K452DRAFT_301771 [Aplosporella prunicola CBS 121167]|uniref:Uncharacterized protein n=1 Tax=Aplosporella prunicola CBS 121167 TaxID=1176127 RepID=A0A6A6B054_9PEZI|nr:uncharacterized protein K452DRAFT_301771 [Aplosporella prunicola CBS 121167]KAF2137572.1 hypothetical protein K452DRAFT_301771 [Aplosporella prunicola CBS 121167]
MAASSSPTSIPPLLDRSNKRHRFLNLDSSESTPSDTSSIYTADNSNAAKPASPRSHFHEARSSGEVQRARARAPTTPHGPGIAVRFTNRPDATPLTTILEQRSASTLRERASQLLARASLHQRPSSSVRPDTPAAADHGTPTDRKDAAGTRVDGVNRRQISWSINVDEATLRELHEIISSQRPARQDPKSASSLGSSPGTGSDPARPFSPIHPAYARSSTPKGAPRWPGDLPTMVRAPTRTVSRARSVGHALRDFIRGPRGNML